MHLTELRTVDLQERALATVHVQSPLHTSDVISPIQVSEADLAQMDVGIPEKDPVTISCNESVLRMPTSDVCCSATELATVTCNTICSHTCNSISATTQDDLYSSVQTHRPQLPNGACLPMYPVMQSIKAENALVDFMPPARETAMVAHSYDVPLLTAEKSVTAFASMVHGTGGLGIKQEPESRVLHVVPSAASASMPLEESIQLKTRLEEEELHKRLVNNLHPLPKHCSCPSAEVSDADKFDSFYTQLGTGSSLYDIRRLMEGRSGFSGNAIRILKLRKVPHEGKSAQGCPIAKEVVRRQDSSEKILVLVKQRRGHVCPEAFIIVNIVDWEGLSIPKADEAYQLFKHVVPRHGRVFERACQFNPERNCACQGWNELARGASFSFGCSYGPHFNGCKYKRSESDKRFNLQGASEETMDLLRHMFNELADNCARVFHRLAPDAFRNQTYFENRHLQCRIGTRTDSNVTQPPRFPNPFLNSKSLPEPGDTTLPDATKAADTMFNLTHENKKKTVQCATPSEVLEEGMASEKILCDIPGNLPRPFSGATCCLDFSAHGHFDKTNMLNGSTVVLTLLRSDSTDEQLHALPYYLIDTRGQSALEHNAGVEILDRFPTVNRRYYSKQLTKKQMEKLRREERKKEIIRAMPEQNQPVKIETVEQPAFSKESVAVPRISTEANTLPPQISNSYASPANDHLSKPLPSFDELLNPDGSRRWAFDWKSGFPLVQDTQSSAERQTIDSRSTLETPSTNGPIIAANNCAPSSNRLPVVDSFKQLTGLSSQSGSSALFPPGQRTTETLPSPNPARLVSSGAQTFIKPVSSVPAAHSSLIPFSLPSSTTVLLNSPVGIPSSQKLFSPVTSQCVSRPTAHIASNSNTAARRPERPDSVPTMPSGGKTPTSNVGLSCSPPPQGQRYGYEEWCDNIELCSDDRVGGVAIALPHGSVIMEAAKHEYHATTALKYPNRFNPTRISVVFYQHRRMNDPYHGYYEHKAHQANKAKAAAETGSGESSPSKRPASRLTAGSATTKTKKIYQTARAFEDRSEPVRMVNLSTSPALVDHEYINSRYSNSSSLARSAPGAGAATSRVPVIGRHSSMWSSFAAISDSIASRMPFASEATCFDRLGTSVKSSRLTAPHPPTTAPQLQSPTSPSFNRLRGSFPWISRIPPPWMRDTQSARPSVDPYPGSEQYSGLTYRMPAKNLVWPQQTSLPMFHGQNTVPTAWGFPAAPVPGPNNAYCNIRAAQPVSQAVWIGRQQGIMQHSPQLNNAAYRAAVTASDFYYRPWQHSGDSVQETGVQQRFDHEAV